MVTQSYTTYIHTTPQRLWDALTTPQQTVRYFDFMEGFMAVESTWVLGSPVKYRVGGTPQIEGQVLEVEWSTLLITSFTLLYYPEEGRDARSRMAWEITPMGEVCKLTTTWSDSKLKGRPPAMSRSAPPPSSQTSGSFWRRAVHA